MITNGLSIYRGKRVLLLQGPLGPFFSRLSKDLTRIGAEVHKVNFNGGDWLFFNGPNTHVFRDKPENWPAFFTGLLEQLNINSVLLFGDCREYHRQAHAIATKKGIEVGVFEEGYLRPDWITLEHAGANGHSEIPRTADFYRGMNLQSNECHVHVVGNTFAMTAMWAIMYYLASSLLWPMFRYYRHHRPLNLLEAVPWIRAGWRKYFYSIKERNILHRLIQEKSKNYFLVPLQVHNDAQVCVHSPYSEVCEFIIEVVSSFALHGPRDAVLVIKHHPLDRGYHDYAKLIGKLQLQFDLGGRLLYVHDLHLPTLLDHATGVVVINSTVGLSALLHGAPTLTKGNAFYNIDGLTYQDSLDSFWSNARSVSIDIEVLNGFRLYLQRCKLINGNYYKRLAASEMASGLAWTQGCQLPFCDSSSVRRIAPKASPLLHSPSHQI